MSTSFQLLLTLSGVLIIVCVLGWYAVEVADAQCVGDVSEELYGALEDLYYATDGDNWFWNQTDPADSQQWTFPSSVSDPCSSPPWYGLTCNVSSTSGACTIVKLKLQRFHLVGTLPASIGNLTGLETLALTENMVRGVIPEEIGELSLLKSLNLSVNILGGSLPDKLWTLKKLENLYLYINRLSGSFPAQIAELESLEILAVNTNKFRGSLPDELGKLSALQELNIDFNRFFGQIPTTIGQLTSLVELYADENLLFGTLPTELGLLTRLEVLSLDNNHLQGSIPSELWLLSNLQFLELYVNTLTGTLGSEVGRLPYVTVLSLNSNSLNGSLPTELGLLTSLTYLSLNNNAFSGTFPTELCQLSLLALLELFVNDLSGPIPTQIGQLTAMEEILLDHNSFSGSMPSQIIQLTALSLLQWGANNLTGTLLSELALLPYLGQINVGYNRMIGTIPTEYGNFLVLNAFFFNDNCLTGPIPSQIGLVTTLVQVDVSYNYLNESIPTELGLLSSMLVLNLQANSLTGQVVDLFAYYFEVSTIYLSTNLFDGPLPDRFGNFSSVRYLEMKANYFTSTVPAFYFQSPLIQGIILDNNMLTGPISEVAPLFYQVELIYLYGNYLTSTVPAIVGRFLKAYFADTNYFTGPLPAWLESDAHLEALTLSVNYLSGQVPLGYGSLSELQVLNISRNMLHGELIDLFENTSSLRRLQEIDLSQNDFSGPIPASVFSSESNRSKNLKEVALYSNCFTGSIPSTICDSKLLTTVVLDAMNTGPSCRRVFLHNVVKAVVSTHPLSGTIPSCIWQMPSLLTLHLSGNSLEGSLRDLIDGSTALQDVSLASNKLTGSVPQSWQNWGKFTQLDLSSNRLSGTLADDFVVSSNNTNLDLTVNRLSGQVPSSFRQVESISVLNGNLFQCDQATVPVNDPSSKLYVCGASDFNIALAAWMGFGLIVLGLIATQFRLIKEWLRNYDACVRMIQQSNHTQPGSSLLEFMGFMKNVCALNGMLAIMYLVLVMVVYVVFKTVPTLSALYSTHTDQYTWVTTVVFLEGVGPTVFVLIVLVLSVLFVDCVFASSSQHLVLDGTGDAPSRGYNSIRWADFQYYLSIGTVLLIHMLVTVVVNVGYVYALIVGLSTGGLLALQLALSLFKLTWNNIFVPFALKNLKLSRHNACLCSSFMMLFTFLVSPLVATFFSDTTCFRYILTGQPSVSSSFYTGVFVCEAACATTGSSNAVCHNFCDYSQQVTEEVFTSVTPSWLYSFQCSSSVITNYIPVLVLAYGISGLVMPILFLAYLRLPHSLIESYVPKPLRRSLIDNTIYSNGVAEMISDDKAATSRYDGNAQLPEKPIFNAVNILSKLSLNIAVMLTFGLATPLLTVEVAIDTLFLLIRFRVLLQRYLAAYLPSSVSASVDKLVIARSGEFAGSEQSLRYGIQRVEDATKDSLKGLPPVVLLIMLTCGCFWGFFVFDMLGDVHGIIVGAVMLAVTVAAVLIAHLVFSRLIASKYIPGIEFLIAKNEGSIAHGNRTGEPIRNPILSERSRFDMAMNEPFERTESSSYVL
jgi:Leucine-rich repeat (LRR) protein